MLLTLLAESKTMLLKQEEVSTQAFEANCPIFESSADDIMAFLNSLSSADISERLKISASLALKAKELAYDFPHKASGNNALKSFIGDAYRGFDLNTMPEDAILRAKDNLRIISSVYGILKPTDIIKPYRFEFNVAASSANLSSIQIFKPKITTELVKYIKLKKITDIIDLLPADADKCIDWKIVRAFTNVHKIVFKSISDAGELKTPLAKRLKELRGIMAREILIANIQTFRDLKNHESQNYVFSEEHSKTGMPVFISPF